MDKNKKLKMVRWVLGAVAGIGAGFIVSGIIKTTCPQATGALKKIAMGVGEFGLTGAAGIAAAAAVTENFDTVVEIVEVVFKKLRPEQA
jgi:hypothetical protein